MALEALRGNSFMGSVGGITAKSLPFMADFALTGGAVGAIAKGAAKAAGKNAAKAAGKNAAKGLMKFHPGNFGKAAKNAFKDFAKTTAATSPLIATRGLASGAQRIANATVGEDEHGNPTFNRNVNIGAEMASGIADTGIEVVSEATGGLFRLALPVRASRKVVQGYRKLMSKLPAQRLVRTLNRTKAWNGTVGEIAEEYVGDILRGVAGIDSNGTLAERIEQTLPTTQEFMQMAVSFGITPAILRAPGFAATLAKFRKDTARDLKRVLNSTEAKKIQQTAATDTQGKENLPDGMKPLENVEPFLDSSDPSDKEVSPEEQAKNVIGVNGGNSVQSIPVKDLQIDPQQFQFKSRADKVTGVDESNKIGGTWDPKTAGNLYVWEDQDGKKFVVNGHHRFDLARKNNVENVNAIIDREADGVTAEQARRNGILINIRDEQGDVRDYAEFVRQENMDENTAEKEGILSRSKGRQGYTIGRYAGNTLYSAYRNGEIPDGKAAEIANIARGDEAIEAVGIKEKELNAEELRQLLNALKALERPKTEQGDLFGFDESALELEKSLSKQAAKHIREIRETVNAARDAIKNPVAARKLGVNVGKDAEKLLKKALREQAEWDKWYLAGSGKREILMDELGLKQNNGISPKEELPEKTDNADQKSRQEFKRFEKKYRKQFGNIVSADNVKLMFREEGYNPHDEESGEFFHRKAAPLTGQLFDEYLKTRKEKGNGNVIFTGGGNGSGKSSVLSAEAAESADFVMDSTMVNRDVSRKSIQKVIDNGQKPVLAFAYRDPADAWFNGVQKRNKSPDGHIVPKNIFASTHSKAKENFIALVEEFGDKVEYIIRESLPGNTSRKMTLDELKAKPKYTKDQILEIINGNDKSRVGRLGEEIRRGVQQESPENSQGGPSNGSRQGNLESGNIERLSERYPAGNSGRTENSPSGRSDETVKLEASGASNANEFLDKRKEPDLPNREKDTETQYSLQRVPRNIADFQAMPAHPKPSKTKFSTVKELYDLYKKEYLGQTIRTASGHDITFKPGHFFRLIAGTPAEGRKGFIAKAKNAADAIAQIEEGKIGFGDIAGYQISRAEYLPVFKDVITDADFWIREKENKILFGKKYSDIKKADGFLAVTLEIEKDGKLGPVSFHPRRFSEGLFTGKEIHWNIANALDHANASGDVSSRDKSSELIDTIAPENEMSNGKIDTFSTEIQRSPREEKEEARLKYLLRERFKGAEVEFVKPQDNSQRAVAEFFRKELGKNVRFFKGTLKADGFHHKGKLYLNTKNEKPLMAAAFHEYTHDLRENDPDSYSDLMKNVMRLASEDQLAEWKKNYNRRYSSRNYTELDDAALEEEFIADVAGSVGGTESFFRKIGEQSPNLLERFLAWLKQLKDALYKDGEFDQEIRAVIGNSIDEIETILARKVVEKRSENAETRTTKEEKEKERTAEIRFAISEEGAYFPDIISTIGFTICRPLKGTYLSIRHKRGFDEVD